MYVVYLHLHSSYTRQMYRLGNWVMTRQNEVFVLDSPGTYSSVLGVKRRCVSRILLHHFGCEVAVGLYHMLLLNEVTWLPSRPQHRIYVGLEYSLLCLITLIICKRWRNVLLFQNRWNYLIFKSIWRQCRLTHLNVQASISAISHFQISILISHRARILQSIKI